MIWKWFCTVSAIFVFLGVTLSTGAEEKSSQSDVSTLGEKSTGESLFKLEEKNQTNLLQLKALAIGRKHTGTETGAFGLEALYGHLFLPSNEQFFSGYYLLTGRLESNNRQRFNATLSYFTPKIGGESKLTYRLLHAQIQDNLPLSGEFEEGVLEQGFGLTYRKRLKILLKEFGLKYGYTHLGGESIETGPYNLDSETSWRHVRANAGFGDVDTHDVLFEVATGSDLLDYPVLRGIRLDLGGGYQHVTNKEYLDTAEVVDEGFTGIAELKACTSFGVLKGWYQDSQAARTGYGGYQLGGLDVYYKNIDYKHGEQEEVIGVAITLDLFDTGAAFDTRCRPFFNPSEAGYTSVYQMGHISGLDSNELTARPKVNVVYDDIYTVDKTNLPDNVQVDASGEPSLVVTTKCPQLSVRSVVPASAAGAVSVSGKTIIVNLAALPAVSQTIKIRTNDGCCGYTQVRVTTVAGSVSVSSVDVREGLGCPRPEPVPPPTPPTPPICNPVGVGLNGDCTACPCQAGLNCTGGICATPPPICVPGGLGESCTVDCGCQAGGGLVCSSGTCLYINNTPCNNDTDCVAGLCGSGGPLGARTCGGDSSDPCTNNSECKSVDCFLPAATPGGRVCR